MTSGLDFTLPGPLLAGLIIGLLLPAFLWGVTRIPALTGRNPVQFLISCIAVFAVWVGATIVVPVLRPADFGEAITGALAIGGAALLYLEMWGLMSRGYTLSILIAMRDAQQSMSMEEIAHNYRDGEGLGWIMDHRLKGLEASGLIRRDGDRISLTAPWGLAIAHLYRLSIAILGLRKTG